MAVKVRTANLPARSFSLRGQRPANFFQPLKHMHALIARRTAQGSIHMVPLSEEQTLWVLMARTLNPRLSKANLRPDHHWLPSTSGLNSRKKPSPTLDSNAVQAPKSKPGKGAKAGGPKVAAALSAIAGSILYPLGSDGRYDYAERPGVSYGYRRKPLDPNLDG